MLIRRFARPYFGASTKCLCSTHSDTFFSSLLRSPSRLPRLQHIQAHPRLFTTATATTQTTCITPLSSSTIPTKTLLMPESSLPKRNRPLIALGIETSCDDTCAAIVTSDRRILSEVIRTQHHLHEPMGGIVPKLAHHAHMRNLPEAVKEAIQKADLGERGIQEIDIVAVTRGPGLAHCLGVGLNAAKTLAAALNKPLIGVHHMEAHALTARLTTTATLDSKFDFKEKDIEKTLSQKQQQQEQHAIEADPYPPFPFLTLLVSGGHTLLLVAHSVDHYTTLATTVDDSIGEAFDKTARELDIPWLSGRAGGPGASLEQFAKESKHPHRYLDQLPIPMSLRSSKHEMKFSFAGLKSAVTRIVHREKDSAAASASTAADSTITTPNSTTTTTTAAVMDEERKRDLAAGFQYCAIEHLCQKVEQGLHNCHKQGLEISSLVISGGVGRNATLRRKMEEICGRFEHHHIVKPAATVAAATANSSQATIAPVILSGKKRHVRVICPPPKLCTDNAVMIAWTGLERYQRGLIDPYDIDIIPKWPLDMLGTGVVPE